MRTTCDNRSNTSSPPCDNRGIFSSDYRNYAGMYRKWLRKMVEGAPRGTKARLAEHLKLNADMVSKMLSGVRDITADELRQISKFFEVMPPGFEAFYPAKDSPIKTDDEILAMLNRIEGLGERGVELAMMAIQMAKTKGQTPSQPSADDQSAPATPRRESQSSR